MNLDPALLRIFAEQYAGKGASEVVDEVQALIAEENSRPGGGYGTPQSSDVSFHELAGYVRAVRWARKNPWALYAVGGLAAVGLVSVVWLVGKRV